MSSFAAAFIKAKMAFGPALKDKTNPAFRSKYADLGACIDAVEDALLANGIAFIQETFDEERPGVTVETVFLHESGFERRCGKLHVPVSKHDPQGYGSALTYARRYSLMAACGIAPEDDDGNAAVKAKHTSAPLEAQLEASIEHVRTKKNGAMGDAWAEADRALATETKRSLRKFSERIAPMAPAEAYDLIEEQGLNHDEKTFLWGFLDSKLRSALKQHKETQQLLLMKDRA